MINNLCIESQQKYIWVEVHKEAIKEKLRKYSNFT